MSDELVSVRYMVDDAPFRATAAELVTRIGFLLATLPPDPERPRRDR